MVQWGLSNAAIPSGVNGATSAIASGTNFHLALLTNGTVVAWGTNSSNQLNVPSGLTNVVSIAASSSHALALRKNGTVAAWGSNSSGESTVPSTLTNVIAIATGYSFSLALSNNAAMTAWGDNAYGQRTLPLLTNNNVRLIAAGGYQGFASIFSPAVQYQLESIGTNYSVGKVILSPSKSGYGNTNFVVDDIRHGPGWPPPEENYSDYAASVSNAISGINAAAVPGLNITYAEGIETNGLPSPPHITNAVSVAGYISWGYHSQLGNLYATSGLLVWSGRSSWYQTIESFNGQRLPSSGNFIQWFSSTALGGINYSNTPVGAVSHVDEPHLDGVNDSQSYFGLWAQGKSFGICAWYSQRTPYFQAVGDPLVSR